MSKELSPLERGEYLRSKLAALAQETTSGFLKDLVVTVSSWGNFVILLEDEFHRAIATGSPAWT